MALKLKFKDEHGILHINMSPTSSPEAKEKPDLTDPKFDSINNRFGQYDLFGGKYDLEGQSLFRSRYNSVEEELANTPYAFATERLRFNNLDVTIKARGVDASPSKDIEDDRFFNRNDDDLFGPTIDNTPAFTVTQLIHAQDRYFDLSSRSSVVDSPRVNSLGLEVSGREKEEDEAFKVLSAGTAVKAVQVEPPTTLPVVPTSKRKRESSFAILTETPVASRPTSPRSLPVEIRSDKRNPFKGRGFREETSRHNTPKTSAANSRANSPPRRRTNSLSKIDKMAQAATLPLPIPTLSRPHSPRNFVKENIEEVREISELNRERHEAEAEQKRLEEEEALLKEMGLLDKNAKSDAIRSVVCSRTNSRSNSPTKIKLRSRSNSPSAILHYENIRATSKEFINAEDGMAQPVTHRSRIRTVSKSQPQSNEGSPKHSKIPKRQNSVSPNRMSKRDGSMSRRPVENGLKNQKYMSSSASSIHETIRIGSQVHDKRNSKSTQHLTISPALIKGKPPISPGRGGPPPANRSINSKRLSPIVGTPNKSPIEDLKPSSAKTTPKPSPATRKTNKTAGNTPATSRLNSRQPSRTVSRDPSPEKRKTVTKTSTSSKIANNVPGKPVARTTSTRTTQKPAPVSKPEPKKPMSRTNSVKSLVRTPSSKTLNEKPPLAKRNSKKDLTEKNKSTTKLNEVGTKKDSSKDDKTPKKTESAQKEKTKNDKGCSNAETKTSVDSGTDAEEQVMKQDNETQYDKITNEKGELVLMTKRNIVSMTTAAITSQPLAVVTTVTNQLPAALEKAREKGIFERLNSRDSLAPKDEQNEGKSETKKDNETMKPDTKDAIEEKEKTEEKKPPKVEEKKPPAAAPKPKEPTPVFVDDSIKLKLLQPPYNNPQVERARQKIDSILKEPEVSPENILAAAAKVKEPPKTFKSVADKTKTEVKETKDEVAKKLTEIKDEAVKKADKTAADMRSEATKIVDSIITPVETPKEVLEKAKVEVKKEIEPIVMVVNEKKKNGPAETVEKMTEALVKGEPEVEVQSSNLSTPGDKMAPPKKMADGNDSDKSQSNGGFPQSTSTTPKPPARGHRKTSKDEKNTPEPTPPPEDQHPKPPNICQRLMGKCKTKCCPCCIKGEDDEATEMEDAQKKGTLSKLNCCKKGDVEDPEQIREVARAAGKEATIEFENEIKRKLTFLDIFCGCCGRRRRVGDVSGVVSPGVMSAGVVDAPVSGVVAETGCWGKRRGEERRDSILSDRPPPGCCTRLCTWMAGACRRRSEASSSRRTSMFSKNKSMSPTLPPEDTRKKLDSSLVEHTSVMKGAIPVLPIVLAYFCLLCNVCVPGLGTILSGLFCLCFGIPRFGVYDGAKQRIVEAK
ncbi:protein stum-like [Ostrinia nubilalis]|uniref:protein stum-like n=1 Tax=Ostrinia nubilalis TaxID=29057 RepID=UPI00308225D5